MILSSKLLSRFPELVHGFTTRTTPDFSTHSIITLKQIHSNKVFIVQKEESLFEEGDALITQQPGLNVGVRTADCVPLLIYDPQAKAVSAIHVGWRGLMAGVIENALQVLSDSYHSKPASLIMALGPALCPGCFEIGPEVAEKFRGRFGDRLIISPGKNDRSFLDLREACRLVLLEKGVLPKNIEHLSYCTSCQPELFYSYRRGEKDGRQLSFIGLICNY